MKCAMNDAKLSADAIDYINANGTSTPHNDKFKTRPKKTAFVEQA